MWFWFGSGSGSGSVQNWAGRGPGDSSTVTSKAESFCGFTVFSCYVVVLVLI